MSEPDAVTAGYERAQQFLADIGMSDLGDVTDIRFRRDQDAGQRKQFTVLITVVQLPGRLG